MKLSLKNTSLPTHFLKILSFHFFFFFVRYIFIFIRVLHIESSTYIVIFYCTCFQGGQWTHGHTFYGLSTTVMYKHRFFSLISIKPFCKICTIDSGAGRTMCTQTVAI